MDSRSFIFCVVVSVSISLHGGTTVPQRERVLKTIKDTALAGGLPELKIEVGNLADEVQKLKDLARQRGEIEDD